MKRLVLFLMTMVFSITVLSWRAPQIDNKVTAANGAPNHSAVDESVIKCLYYDKREFNQSLMSGKYQPETGVIAGGIVPHHLLAASMIAPFFELVMQSKPDVVVMLGPNHQRIGQEKIHTGFWDWETPYGRLSAYKPFIESIEAQQEVGKNRELLEEDHAISALIPYVSYFRPDAEVVPMLLHGNMTLAECKSLADVLYTLSLEERTLFVASIDFSHYLTPPEANEMDAITLKAIEDKDYEGMLRMNNDNLDARPVLVTFLMLMERLNAQEMLLQHANAQDFMNQPIQSSTGYFTFVFTKDPQ